jgi:transposase-like protein
MKTVLPDNLKILLMFFDERSCRRWLILQLHPQGIHCPRCEAPQDSDRIRELAYSFKRLRCRECAHRFNAFSGTAFERTQMSAQQIVLLLMLFRLGRSDAEISRAARVSRPTVGRWRRYFRACGSRIV